MLIALNPPQQEVSAVQLLDGIPKVAKILYLPNVNCWCPYNFLDCPSYLVVGGAYRKFIHAVSDSLVVRTSSAISCGFGGVRPGRLDPESLSCGDCMEGCRASSSRSVGCGVPCPANFGGALASCDVCPAGSLLLVPLSRLPVSSLSYTSARRLGRLEVDQVVAPKCFYKPMARGSLECLYCCVDFCDAKVNSHDLSHAGEEHSSSSPDRVMLCDDGDDDLPSPRHIGLGVYSACCGATSSSADVVARTPRNYHWMFKLGRRTDCLDHEIRLDAVKAMGHPLLRMSLGRGVGQKEEPALAYEPNAQNSSRGSRTHSLANRIRGGAPRICANDCTQRLWLDARSCPP